jgi:threonine dehydrogenase-like Zn-dependent dehydrogenase
MMKAARIYEPGKIVVEEVPIPQLGEKDVLIKVHSVGLCGTDVGVVHGYVPAKFPVTLGHEFAGTVAQVGSTSLCEFKEGDPVRASGGWGCGECEACRQGRGTFCKDRASLGRKTDGCMAEFVKVDYRAVDLLPPDISFDEAQNLSNIRCVLHAFNKIPAQFRNSAVVFGPGNMGQIMLQILKLKGTAQVVMVGTRDLRLEMAKSFGADHVVNIKQEDPVKAILGWYQEGVEVVVEATGIASSLQNCCDVVKQQGAIVSLGIFSEKVKDFDFSFLYYKEPVIYGSRGASGTSQEAIQLLTEKKLQLLPMITHRFPLEETAQAFKVFEDKDESALRIVIEPVA